MCMHRYRHCILITLLWDKFFLVETVVQTSGYGAPVFNIRLCKIVTCQCAPDHKPTNETFALETAGMYDVATVYTCIVILN